MIEPGLKQDPGPNWIPSSQAGSAPPPAEGVRSEFGGPPTRPAVRRIRYYCSLLITGYHHALSPDPQSRSLRTERIALGIDLPELDTVPLWSTRREDGTVSIPFIEFILARICEGLDGLCAHPLLSARQAAAELTRARRGLGMILRETTPEGEAPALPRLGDIYISEELLKELCGPEGLLLSLLKMPDMRVD